MLRIKDVELKMVSQGYHFDENGRKFVRIFASLNFCKVQIKIIPKKTMHIKSISPDFPYTITDNWVEITFNQLDAVKNAPTIEEYINKRCTEVWFTD
jgi:hypothetical protein